MSEDPSNGIKQRARVWRGTLDRDVDRRSDEAAAGAPAVGKHTLTEGWSAGDTALDASVFFERSLGEARAQLAALARAVAARDRVAAITTAYSLRRSLDDLSVGSLAVNHCGPDTKLPLMDRY